MNPKNVLATAGALMTLGFSSAALMACGPAIVNFDPSNAKEVLVRPSTGAAEFCPGATFQVELIAKLQNGTTCSSTDRTRGCQGEKDAVISPKMVRIEASSGSRTGDLEKFLWAPPGDILATADTGIVLRGWLEKTVESQYQKSVVGESELRPVYSCRMSGDFSLPPAGGGGQPGERGPDVQIAITSLATPFYPDAALIRVEAEGSRLYYISPTPDQPVHIVTRGQDGGVGQAGQSGVKGEDGRSGSSGSPCSNGENGRDGTDGGPGGPGGDGGSGGKIRILVDKAAGDKLLSRIVAESVGGAAGPGGPGGRGGPGGQGGSAGPSGPSCSGQSGSQGRDGRSGAAGVSGRPGQDGPAPTVGSAARQSLFGDEAETLSRIETAAKKRSK